MSSLKRAGMAVALIAAMIGVAPAAMPEPKGKQPRKAPPITRYKPRDRRVKASKQDDQPAKEARRAARQANDKQTMERQRAKWGDKT